MGHGRIVFEERRQNSPPMPPSARSGWRSDLPPLAPLVIPGRASWREPGIHNHSGNCLDGWSTRSPKQRPPVVMDSGLSLRAPRNDGEGVASSARRANHRGLTSSPETKNISFYRNSDLRYQSAVLSPRRDVSRSSRYAGHGMRWTLWRQAGFSPDENVRSGRRNRVVLAPRPWRYLREVSSRTTGARKAASPGRARISRKTIAGESRDVSAVPVKSVCILSLLSAHGDAGAVSVRLSLRPLRFRGPTNWQSSGEIAP
jgi:hypothetical protein